MNKFTSQSTTYQNQSNEDSMPNYNQSPPPAYGLPVYVDQRPPENEQQGLGGWCERQQKNKPQSNSVGAGVLLLMVAGLHIGWGVFRIYFNSSWAFEITTLEYFTIILVFYIGTNIGCFIGSRMIYLLEKKRVYYICVGLNVVSSVSFIIGYNSIIAIYIGRILAGLGYGICYITVLVHASENCVKQIRGMILTTFNYTIVSSIFTLSALNIIPTIALNTDKMVYSVEFWIGCTALAYTLLAAIFVPFLTYESVVHLILKGDDQMAIRNMIKLRNESVETWEIRKDFIDLKTMVDEDLSEQGGGCCSSDNRKVFILVLLTKILSSLSTIMAINIVMYGFIITGLSSSWTDILSVGLILLAPRIVMAIFPLFLSDTLGRRPLIIISGIISSVTLFVIGLLLVIFSWEQDEWLRNTLLILTLVYQGGIGIGINSIPDVLTSEAFSIVKKPASIRSLLVIEHIIQIMGVAIFVNIQSPDFALYASIVTMVIGAIMIILTAIIAKVLPETKNKTLRETRDLFRAIKFMER